MNVTSNVLNVRFLLDTGVFVIVSHVLFYVWPATLSLSSIQSNSWDDSIPTTTNSTYRISINTACMYAIMADSISQNDSTGKANIKKKGKKRRISKHIADAKLKSSELSSSPLGGTLESTDSMIPAPSASVTTSNKKQKLSKQKHTKDPVDVEGYLMAWKQQQQQHDQSSDDGSNLATTTWKFNKNTQSWLIRHLFDSTKISKSVFAIALQYFLNSNVNVQQRLRDDATKRAVQYQQDQQEEKGTNNQGNDEKDRDDNDAPQNEDDESPELILEKNRRKEYKRARKILETLVVDQQATTGK